MNNKITTKYLEENNDQVIVTVPAYDEMEAGQTVILWWNSRKTTAIPAVVVTAQHVTDQKIPIVIPGAQFTALPDSRVYLQYNLVSRVGYEGPPSEMAYVDVSLQPEPTNLQDPIVPLAADGLIDLDDANAGVEIQILAYTNIVNGDSVVAYWGSSSLSPEMVSANEFPVFVSVPRAIVLKEGSGTIQVRYEVQRGASVTQSSSIPVTVDVSTVGPVDPVPDTNVNEALQPPSIRGGSNKNAVNTLLADDKGKAATAIIPFYQSGRGNPAAPIITEEGAVIELIWGEMPNKPIPLELIQSLRLI
ncbi:hypothetical protein HED51_21000 [Ochrobactrum grignonense]|nr:hypothetical protein [Brucella grignonensis]